MAMSLRVGGTVLCWFGDRKEKQQSTCAVPRYGNCQYHPMMKVIGTAAAVALYSSECSGIGRMLDVDLL